jgi:DNA-binding response OmpR family regulator
MSDSANHKILLIDDDPDIVRLMELRLQHAGYRVVTAYDGASALEKIRQEKPALMLLDVSMPRMDGYTLLRMLRREEGLKDLPVIVLTAKQRLKELFDLEDIAGFFVKPYQPEALLDKIREILSRRPE